MKLYPAIYKFVLYSVASRPKRRLSNESTRYMKDFGMHEEGRYIP